MWVSHTTGSIPVSSDKDKNKMTKSEIALREAVAKGYHFDENNSLIGLRGRPIKYRINTEGYPVFNIGSRNKAIPVFLHRLKAFLLYGEKMFEKGIEVRHLNSIKTDWSDKNIAIGSPRDNRYDNPIELRKKWAEIRASAIRKITVTQRDEIRKLYHSGIKVRDIMIKYNLKSKGTVSNIVNRYGLYK